MKDQYLGDIHDYRKFGLLRILLEIWPPCSGRKLLVAWMRTPNDQGKNEGRFGKFRRYLADDNGHWRIRDPELFDWLKINIADIEICERRLSALPSSGLFRDTAFYDDLVPDKLDGRTQWGRRLQCLAASAEAVFVDPDNGVEVPSRKVGRAQSSKYVMWSDLSAIWSGGSSLIIYQHFRRESHLGFMQRSVASLIENLRNAHDMEVLAFKAKQVCFLIALQARHQPVSERLIQRLQESWEGQIVPMVRKAGKTIECTRHCAHNETETL